MATANTQSQESLAQTFAPNRVRRRTMRSPMSAAWKLRMSVAGGIVLLMLSLMAIFAPLLTPYTTEEGSIRERLQPPIWQEGGTWSHPLGTDGIGRDYATRLMYGGRIALTVGLLATLLSAAIGITLGMAAGYFGGWIDAVISIAGQHHDYVPVHPARIGGDGGARHQLHECGARAGESEPGRSTPASSSSRSSASRNSNTWRRRG